MSGFEVQSVIFAVIRFGGGKLFRVTALLLSDQITEL